VSDTYETLKQLGFAESQSATLRQRIQMEWRRPANHFWQQSFLPQFLCQKRESYASTITNTSSTV